MLEIGFPVAAAMTALCLDPAVLRRGEHMELSRELLIAEMIDPSTGELARTTIEVRQDPLTGHSSRILPERGLMPASDFDLEAFARESQPSCPFCPARVDQLTPKLPPGIHPDGRISAARRCCS